MQRFLRWAAVLMLGLIVARFAFAAERSAQAAAVTFSEDLPALFVAARDPSVVLDVARKRYVGPREVPDGVASLWPIRTFLLAEALRARGARTEARALYRALLEQAGSGDPEVGSSPLAVFALWRLLDRAASDSEDNRAILNAGANYWQRSDPAVRGLFEAPQVLGALPQLRDAILRGFIANSWALGDREQAYRWMAEYLGVARTTVFTATERQVLEDGARRGVISADSLLLGLAKRVYGAGKSEEARTLFETLRRSATHEVAMDARLQLAQFLRDPSGRSCATDRVRSEVEAILALRPSPELAERALYFRSQRYLQRNCPKQLDRYQQDLDQLLRDFPQGRWTKSALSYLAADHLDNYFDSGNDTSLELALRVYGQLRVLAQAPAHTRPEDVAGSTTPQRVQELSEIAWLRPALALYARGRPGDRLRATELLEEMLTRWADSPLRLSARFWLARILAETGRPASASEQLQAIISDSPYDYFAIRARMTLQLGLQARTRIDLDPATRAALASGGVTRPPQQSKAAAARSPSRVRLAAVLEAGVYQRALDSYLSLRRDAFPGMRIEDTPLDALDSAHRMVDVAIVMALRQEAVSAAEHSPEPSNRIEIALNMASWRSAGQVKGDWPIAVALSSARALPEPARRALQHEGTYLPAAYPPAYKDVIRKHAAVRRVAPELLYAVIRTESIFNPAAESSSGALGLFQFLPGTFRYLNGKWRLIKKTDAQTEESFLLTPDANIGLGARWFTDELLRKQDGNLLWALMAHNAGPGAVARWKTVWRRFGRLDDYDFMTETARFEETRGFTQRALTAYWLSAAMRMFGEPN